MRRVLTVFTVARVRLGARGATGLRVRCDLERVGESHEPPRRGCWRGPRVAAEPVEAKGGHRRHTRRRTPELEGCDLRHDPVQDAGEGFDFQRGRV